MKQLLLISLLAVAAAARGAVSLQDVDDGADSYKVRATIAADPEWPLDAVAEVALDQQQEGSYAVVFEALRVRVVRRDQAGKETELALFTDRAPIAEAPLKVVVARDRWRIRVIANDELWLTAFDDTLGPGAVAAGVGSPKLSLTEAEVQGTEPVYFADDFMREKDTTGDWQPRQGRWTMTGVSQADTNQKGGPQAQLSSNPFAFRCSEAASGALATVGSWFWDTYRFEASVRTAGDGAVGLCALLQDPDNYLAFRWSRSGGGGERQLVAVRDGRADILAISHGGWANDQWYRLSIEIVGGHVIVQIDGQTTIEADTRLFGQGQVGLWAEEVTFADFDDVEVVATETVCDTFALRTQDRWRDIGGEWVQDNEAEAPLNPGLRRLTGGDGMTLTGSPQWEDYRVTAICRSEARGGFGVVACYQDPQNYLALRWGSRSAPAKWRNKLELVRVREGQESLLAHPVAFNAQLWHKLSLEAQDGFVRARVGDVPVFETFDATLGGGKAGLLGSRAVEFDQVEVTFLPTPPKVEFTKVFTEDRYMTEWAQEAGSWEVAAAPQRDGVIWHRGEFHGDSEIVLDTELFGGKPRTLRLVLAGTRPGEAPPPRAAEAIASAEPAPEAPAPPEAGGPTSPSGGLGPDGGGYALALVQAKEGAKELVVDLQIDGKSVRRSQARLDEAETIRFTKRGQFILAYVDDQCVLGYHDTQPSRPNGLHAAIGVRGGPPVDLEMVEARCDGLFDTTFARAPVEWIVSKGIWETINRWKCDPRWSFFGGYSDLQPLIWSKDDYSGDIMLEAYMGIKMDLPGPPFYLHPSDLCLSIGGDGQDVTSGYSFLYAARNNTCSLLYRNGREIARNESPEARFPATGWDNETQGNKFHRHWFHLVLRKVNRRVVCSVDDKVLFDVPDDGSVTNGKIAVYSVNNGVMVARVRAWYEARAPRQPFPDLGALQAEAAEEAGAKDADPYRNDFERGLGDFAQEFARVPVLLKREPTGDGRCLTVTNLRPGDKFAITAVARPFKIAERPRLSFRYRIPPEARLNLYAVSRGTWHIIRLTGGERPDTGQRLLGTVPDIQADDQWHRASIDLREAFKAVDPSGQMTVERLVLGMIEPDPYLHAGFGCNPYGCRYSLDDFVLSP